MPDLDPLAAPEITLRGKTFRLPQLELKQVIPITARVLTLGGKRLSELGEEELAALFDIAYLTLTAVEPDLTREEYDRNPPAYYELTRAFGTIMEQAGFIRPEEKPKTAAADDTEKPSGEAPAETSTGTPS